ncbi:unnamed protein product [Oikopleura dioica]|uniref:Uncharacterized protein n=1 Tax=Oikopleura dioica TaxID=34765 RepID=E4Z5K4_OIKDI|nr:unnamed protein product [Oikopleura dioica]
MSSFTSCWTVGLFYAQIVLFASSFILLLGIYNGPCSPQIERALHSIQSISALLTIIFLIANIIATD